MSQQLLAKTGSLVGGKVAQKLARRRLLSVLSSRSDASGSHVRSTSCGPPSRRRFPSYVARRQRFVRSSAAAVDDAETVGTSAAPAASDSKDRVIVLDVTKMMCGGCSSAVKNILAKHPAVDDASVNLITASAVVTLTPEATDMDVDSVVEAVTSKGFPSFLRTVENKKELESQIRKEKEEEEQSERRALQFAWVLALTCYGHHLGHALHALGLHEYAHTEFMAWLENPLVGGALGAAAILGPGRALLADGFRSFAGGRPNMNSLISLGATTSFSAGILSALMPDLSLDPSFLEEPVMLLAFVLLGRSLERQARREASSDLTSLAQLLPTNARLVVEGYSQEGGERSLKGSDEDLKLVSVPTSLVREGEVVRVLPGEGIPVDGTILVGSCSVDESLLTGESRTVFKGKGDHVTGGTILYDSPVLVRATTTGEASALSRIGQLVAEAQGKEAPVQRLADRVAGWFCYGVMTASALTFGFWYTIGLQTFPSLMFSDAMVDVNDSIALFSLKLAIDVLVVACPCALGLATPTAVLVSSSSAAKRGILVKGGQILERMADVTAVVFDKTGTLTEGNMYVVSVTTSSSVRDIDGGELVRLAATAETQTIHPIATALREYAEVNNVAVGKVEASETHPGRGVVATIDGDEVYVGKRDWVIMNCGGYSDTDVPEAERPGTLSLDAATATSSTNGTKEVVGTSNSTEIWVGSRERGATLGCIRVQDLVRRESPGVIENLKKGGKHVYLVSGDNDAISRQVGRECGIEDGNIVSEASPEAKSKFVRDLQARGEVVAVVGDGVNDTVALSASDVGFSIGGADASSSAADVVLMRNKIDDVIDALAIGEATMSKIKQNLGLALVYNALSIPIAAGLLLPAYGVMLTPAIAAGVMSMSSIVVVGNSLTLRR